MRHPHAANASIDARSKSSRTRLRVAMLSAALLLTATVGVLADEPAGKPIPVDDGSFRCITEMTQVRHFYVDNLLGDKEATVAAASAPGGAVYPPGSVVQLLPGEVMVKQAKGFNAATKDWEFFELDVSKDGSKIRRRGFAEVNNRFGGNCFTCHVQARPEWDMICEADHGCAPIPVTRPMIGALQRTDPRCKSQAPVSAEDAEALKQLGEVLKGIMANAPK